MEAKAKSPGQNHGHENTHDLFDSSRQDRASTTWESFQAEPRQPWDRAQVSPSADCLRPQRSVFRILRAGAAGQRPRCRRVVRIA